jgi:hypothetical protein
MNLRKLTVVLDYHEPIKMYPCIFTRKGVFTPVPSRSGRYLKSTLETSGEDGKTTLETSGKDVKTDKCTVLLLTLQLHIL